MAIYVTTEGDTIDSVCFQFYGSSLGYTEIVLSANPDLAFEPAYLTPGLRLTLPEQPSLQVRRPAIELWS